MSLLRFINLLCFRCGRRRKKTSETDDFETKYLSNLAKQRRLEQQIIDVKEALFRIQQLNKSSKLPSIANNSDQIANDPPTNCTLVLDCHTACEVRDIKEKIERRSDKKPEDYPKFIKSDDTVIVDLALTKPSVETFTDFSPLGRFAVEIQTENRHQAATQSTSNNSSRSSTFNLASSNSESAGFDQNLQDRVTNIVEKPRPSTVANAAADTSEPSTSQVNDAASSSATAANSQLASGSGTSKKRKFENITDEVEETNVMHIYCKLFHWDSDQSAWKECGKGNLRLNDEERTSSRLIMRTAGSLILNCRIISGMKFELTNNSKCLRFSSVDVIYLIKGKQMDIERIYSLIEQRLRLLESRTELEQIDEDDNLKRDQIEKLRLDDEDSLINMSNTSDGRTKSSFKSLDTNAKEAAEDSGDYKGYEEEQSAEEETMAEKPDEPEESGTKDEAGQEEDKEQES